MSKTNRGVIFDVDGVLVDSYEAHLQSWQQVAECYDRQMTRQQFAATFGRTSRDIIRELWADAAPSDGEVRTIDDHKERLFREILQAGFPEMPGAATLLASLANHGFKLAVGSSGPSANVQLVLEHVDPDGHVRARVTGDDVTRGKPDPQVFLLAAERLELLSPQCVVVEDAPAGIEAARRAGMACIGLVSHGRTHEELAAADAVVDSLTDLSADAFADLLPD